MRRDLGLTLDPDWTFLNHGSFGACPAPVQAAQAAFRERLERQPVRFLDRELPALLAETRDRLGAFLGADPEGLAFVPNATTGVNAVLGSLRFEPGDELLTTDHEYNAVINAMRVVAERDGARVVVAPIPLPVAGDDAVVEAILDRVTERTRLLRGQPRHEPDRARPAGRPAGPRARRRAASTRSSTARTRRAWSRSTSTRSGAAYYTGQRPQVAVRAEGRGLPVGPRRPPRRASGRR